MKNLLCFTSHVKQQNWPISNGVVQAYLCLVFVVDSLKWRVASSERTEMFNWAKCCTLSSLFYREEPPRVYIPEVHGLCIDKYYSHLFHQIPFSRRCSFHICSYLELCLHCASTHVIHVALHGFSPAILWSQSCDVPVVQLTLLWIPCLCDLWKSPRLD